MRINVRGLGITAVIVIVIFIVAFSIDTLRLSGNGKGVDDVVPYYEYPTATLTIEEFYSFLNYDIPELAGVKNAVDKKDFQEAAKELREYFMKYKGDEQKIFDIGPLPPKIGRVAPKVPAAEVLLNREYTSHGVTHRFRGDIDWTYNPTVEGPEYNKEWTSAFTRFPWLNTLSDAYRRTGNERYAKEIIYVMKDFIRKLPVPTTYKIVTGEPRAKMYDIYNELSTSIRMGAWSIALLAVADSPSLTPDDLVIILKGILEHALHAERNPCLGDGNWQMFEITALLRCAVAFKEFKRSERWKLWAIQRMTKQLKVQVYPDGAQTELCPSYHGGVISNFLRMGQIIKDLKLPLPDEFDETIRNMASYLVKLSRPDGSIPAFSEMSQGSGRSPIVGTVADFFDDKGELLWYSTAGAKGKAPDYHSVSLDWAGYYIMRSGWERDDLYMAVKAGPYGFGHQNEDKLSFELCAYEELFLVDPGYYTYNYTSPWRKYYVSSLAHNTVVPDGLTQHRKDEEHLYVATEPNDAIWICGKTYDFMSGTYDSGYADYMDLYGSLSKQKLKIKHQRDILFIKPELWLVIDWMIPEDRNEHVYEALFQSLLKISLEQEQFAIRGKKATLTIAPVPIKGVSLETEVVSGQLEPIRRGWIYSVNSVNEPLQTAVVRRKATGSTGQAYFLIPGKGKGQSVSIESISVGTNMTISGRLKTSEGFSVDFIAQPEKGRRIGDGELETTSRLKAIIRSSDSTEVIEIDK